MRQKPLSTPAALCYHLVMLIKARSQRRNQRQFSGAENAMNAGIIRRGMRQFANCFPGTGQTQKQGLLTQKNISIKTNTNLVWDILYQPG